MTGPEPHEVKGAEFARRTGELLAQLTQGKRCPTALAVLLGELFVHAEVHGLDAQRMPHAAQRERQALSTVMFKWPGRPYGDQPGLDALLAQHLPAWRAIASEVWDS